MNEINESILTIFLHSFFTTALDFCMHESFNANCSSGRHVILMTSALYGRMEVGRCISEDLSVGCSANVLMYMDTWCTMRASCNVSVRNFVDIHPCQRDFTSFLKAAFRCIRGRHFLLQFTQASNSPPWMPSFVHSRSKGSLLALLLRWSRGLWIDRIIGAWESFRGGFTMWWIDA